MLRRGSDGRPLALDPLLLGGLLVIMVLGLSVLFSASDGHMGTIYRQLVRFAIGGVALLVLAHLNPSLLRDWTPAAYAGTVLLLVAVALFGSTGKGAQRWLDLGIVRFQPSEFMKLTLPMMLAWYLHRKPGAPGLGDTLVCALIIAVPVGLIYRQPDLGTSLLVGTSGAFVLFLAGLRWAWILGLGGLALAASPVLWMFMHDYQRGRVITFLNPESDPLGEGWNIIQSKIAVGSGGWDGKGWQNGTQSHLDFLPESQTDFILAVLAEEFGLVGVVALFAMYLFVIGRGLTIAASSKDAYLRLLAGALSLTFFLYVLVNAGMISGLLPVVGVPLPLVSYGGTSIVSLLAAFGLVLAAYRSGRMRTSR